MNPQAIQLVLKKRGIAYLITDQEMMVIDKGGNDTLLGLNGHPWQGRPLVEVVPELLGNEPALHQILTGELPQHTIGYVNREVRNGTAESAHMHYFNMTTTAYKESSGAITGLLHLLEDVTEAADPKQKIEQIYNDLKLLQYKLDMAAYELGTPLTLVSGLLNLLLEQNSDNLYQEQSEYLQLMAHNAENVMLIVNNLFDIIYAETHQMHLAFQPTDLLDVLYTMAAELQPKLEIKSQALVLQTHDPIPLAFCDMIRVSQILRNLLNNASQHGPKDSQITVSVSTTPLTLMRNRFIQISIQDQGTPIPPEYQTRLFERFYRAKNPITSQINGSGLGLYLAKLLAELHGGRIWCESPGDIGNTFCFTIPTAKNNGMKFTA